MSKEKRGLVFYEKNGIVFSKNYKELMYENLRRILNTSRGERINNPNFGSDIKKYLFRPELELEFLAQEIKNSIERCEPRVRIKNCTFSKDPAKMDTVNINLNVLLLELDEVESFSISL